MRISIGDEVRTIDGHHAGNIDKLILDPTTRDVKRAVLRKGTLFPHDVEVPLDALERRTDGQAILNRTRDQLQDLPEFNEAEYTEWPSMRETPWGYPSAALLWPAAYPFPSVPYEAPDRAALEVGREVEEAHRRFELENAVIDQGSDVISRDGQKVGEVDRLSVDTESGRPVAVVVRRGFIFTKDVSIPGDAIAAVENGAVYLNVDADYVSSHWQ